ncbi:hypothetical protein QUC31_015392 [Theobroma cacao]
MRTSEYGLQPKLHNVLLKLLTGPIQDGSWTSLQPKQNIQIRRCRFSFVRKDTGFCGQALNSQIQIVGFKEETGLLFPQPRASSSNNFRTREEMASFCRSAVMAGSRSLASRSKTLTLKSLTPKPMSSPFSSPSTRSLPCASRILSVLGGVESMMPLHSAIASARLQSSIAVDSSCWSWLSQGIFCSFLLSFVFQLSNFRNCSSILST